MKRVQTCIVVLALMTIIFVGLAQKNEVKSVVAQGQSHVMISPNDVKWGPAPPALPAGAQAAILEGDPTKAGSMFIIRIKLPDGYKVAPHWHPTDEHLTVLEGTFALGIGNKADPASLHELTAGSYAKMPKGVRHLAIAKGSTVVQVQGVGPFEVNYVNLADDPRHTVHIK